MKLLDTKLVPDVWSRQRIGPGNNGFVIIQSVFRIVFLVYKCIVYFYEIEFHTDKPGVSCVRLRMEDAQI